MCSSALVFAGTANLAKLQFMVVDSRTPGLPDSRTPGLPKSRNPGLPDFWTPLKWKVVLLRGSSYFSDEIFGQYEWQSWALETWERTTTLLMWLWPVRMVSRWKLTRRSWLGRCLLMNYITGIITSTPPTSTTGALSLMRVQNSWIWRVWGSTIGSNQSWVWTTVPQIFFHTYSRLPLYSCPTRALLETLHYAAINGN